MLSRVDPPTLELTADGGAECKDGAAHGDSIGGGTTTTDGATDGATDSATGGGDGGHGYVGDDDAEVAAAAAAAAAARSATQEQTRASVTSASAAAAAAAAAAGGSELAYARPWSGDELLSMRWRAARGYTDDAASNVALLACREASASPCSRQQLRVAWQWVHRATVATSAAAAKPPPASARPLYVSCLLYTSPSPRDQRGSRMPSSA